jgi:catechol 2,3-dioxygenase-like lactoylglutathione lyase family enzyme
MDMKLELVLLPVTDIDRARAFYADNMGFTVDVDHAPNEQFRVVQLTPPGSACSITFGKGITEAEPGSVKGTHLVVEDIVKVRDELIARGVEVGEVKHMTAEGWQPGPDPQRAKFNSFADIADPDGNTWVLQEVPPESGS